MIPTGKVKNHSEIAKKKVSRAWVTKVMKHLDN
jgi:hypothetical protein